jgi:hypothetical protein
MDNHYRYFRDYPVESNIRMPGRLELSAPARHPSSLATNCSVRIFFGATPN